MRICELWVTGTVYYLGQYYDGYSRMVQGKWAESKPLPPISFNSTPSSDYDYYNDGLGGIFSGSGWRGSPSYSLKNCVQDPTSGDQPYDCVNGGCVPKTTYSTPGLFVSLAACQAGCAKNSTCTGECVSAEELAALQQAAGTVRSRLCS